MCSTLSHLDELGAIIEECIRKQNGLGEMKIGGWGRGVIFGNTLFPPPPNKNNSNETRNKTGITIDAKKV